MRLTKGDFICVLWRDATAIKGWHSEGEIVQHRESELMRDYPIVSVGIFVSQDDNYLTMALNKSNFDGDIGEVFFIPVGCIKSIRVLK